MHCENPPCVKVCPVQATYKDEEGLVHQNYARCIGCRFCTVACPYGARYFNWHKPEWEDSMSAYLNPDRIEGDGDLQGPAVRPAGVVEKCTFCIQRRQNSVQTIICPPAYKPVPLRRAILATWMIRIVQYPHLRTVRARFAFWKK
jgi:molybdopterin-containing oxidoreductase family iron-sulfur binding subunit